MPYRVKFERSGHTYYWPGDGYEPMMMSRQEAEEVIAEARETQRVLASLTGKPIHCNVSLDWVKAERPARRATSNV